MSRNVSVAQLGPDARKQAVEQIGQQSKRGKYNNVRTEYRSAQGFRVVADSKLEAKLFAELDALRASGDCLWWQPHVRFFLPGKNVYECDALAVMKDGAVRVIDAKSAHTRKIGTYRIKKGLMADRGIEIEEFLG